MESHREPAVAGRFYPASAERLVDDVERLIGASGKPEEARAILAPHAGYVFSGAIAGRVYRNVSVPPTAIVLGPNHTGLGARHAVWPSGAWQLPGRDVLVDEELVGALVARTRGGPAELERDPIAHLREHSIEVQLPFLRARRADVKIVPICLARMSFEQSEALGEALAAEISERRSCGEDVLVVASTDMSHYVSAKTAERLDHMALERIAALDPKGLLEVVASNGISMCGVVPTAVALSASTRLGASRATLVAYGNSADASGDTTRVVGYASAVVS